MKIVRRITISIFIVFLVAFIFFVSEKNNKVNDDNKRLIAQNKTLSNKLVEFLSEDEIKEIVEDTKCEITKTFRVVENYKYTSDGDTKFVVLDQFQNHQPFILEYSNFTFEKNKSYEITFSGENDDHLLEMKVKDIKLTDKVGPDQIQETCKGE